MANGKLFPAVVPGLIMIRGNSLAVVLFLFFLEPGSIH